jgi:RNA polymerase sigma factor (sigma-70 family)
MADRIAQMIVELRDELHEVTRRQERIQAALAALEPLSDAAPPRRPRALMPQRTPKAARAPNRVKEAAKRIGFIAPSREGTLAVLTDKWQSPADLVKASGITPNALRAQLYSLRREGLAESNGERTISIRWRLNSTGTALRKLTTREPRKRGRPAKGQTVADEAPQHALPETLDALSARERTVLEKRDLGGKIRKDIAADIGVSTERARQIEVRARRKLRRAAGVTVEQVGNDAPRLTAPSPKRVSLPVVPASYVPLEVVSVADLVRPDQRFKCVPFSAVIRASQCLERQGVAGSRVKIGSTKGTGARVHEIDHNARSRQFERCKDCELGRQVAARVTVGPVKDIAKLEMSPTG